jgi:hypothetical protein
MLFLETDELILNLHGKSKEIEEPEQFEERELR